MQLFNPTWQQVFLQPSNGGKSQINLTAARPLASLFLFTGHQHGSGYLVQPSDATRICCVHRRAGPGYTGQKGQSKYLKISWSEATQHSCAHINKSAVELIWHVLFWASWQCITLIKCWGISTRMLFGMDCSNTSISYRYHLLRCNFCCFIMTITKNGVSI